VKIKNEREKKIINIKLEVSKPPMLFMDEKPLK